MKRGFQNPRSQKKKAPRTASQPANTTATGNGSNTKPVQAAPAPQTTAVSETASDSDTSAITEEMKNKLNFSSDTDSIPQSRFRVPEYDPSYMLNHPLPPDAPGLYPGEILAYPRNAELPAPGFIDIHASDYRPDHNSILMFTLPLGGEPETTVCTSAGFSPYFMHHEGFKLPLGIRKGAKASWKLTEVAGLGKALFATRNILPGDIIISERPLFIYSHLPIDPDHPSLENWRSDNCISNDPLTFQHVTHKTLDTMRFLPMAVDRLGPGKRKAFFGLADMKSERYPEGYFTKAEGIVRTNAFGLLLPGVPEAMQLPAVCESISRANHSCIPNAHCYFNYVNFSYELRALTPIKANTEITVAYIDSFTPRADRQASLSRDYGFTCTCIACTDPTVDDRLSNFSKVLSKETDLQKQILEELKRGIPQAVIPMIAALTNLYAQNTYLLSSDKVPDHVAHRAQT